MKEESFADQVRFVLRAELRLAMRRKDRDAVRALRSAISAIDNAEAVTLAPPTATGKGRIAGAVTGLGAAEAPRRRLARADVLTLLHAEVEERRAAADHYDDLGRHDEAARLRAEAGVIEQERRRF